MVLVEPRGWVALLLLGALAMAAAATLGPVFAQVGADVGIAHADLRHGGEASVARQCLDGRGGHLFHNPKTSRFGVVCDLDGIYGIVILDEGGREVTAFLKNKMKRFEQVLKYMRNQGYELVQ